MIHVFTYENIGKSWKSLSSPLVTR
jgi:hypothetical protein